MKRNHSILFVSGVCLIVVFSWLAGNGCGSKGTTVPVPSVQQASAAQISVSNQQIAIGNVVLNNMIDQPVSVQNTGSASLRIGQIAQDNPLASPFNIVNDECSGRAVAPSAECSFKVRFSPTSQGDFSDDFDIPSNAPNGKSVTVGISGSGKALRVAINEVSTDGCATGVIELIVNVTDQNNAPLTGLEGGDFHVKENDVLQTLQSASPLATAIPVSVAMLLDYSGTMESQIPTLEAASINFIGFLRPDDEVAVLKFEVFPQLMQDFTDNTALLIDAINAEPTQIGSGGTYLYDSLWYAVAQTAARQKHKAIILISDGKDENSQGVKDVSIKTPEEVIAYAVENEVAIYVVGMGDVNSIIMNLFAEETGGQYYYIADAGQLTGIYQAISNILVGRYSIKYVSSLHGSIPITLEIDVLADGVYEGESTWQAVGCP